METFDYMTTMMRRMSYHFFRKQKLLITWQQWWGGWATIWFNPHLPYQIQLEMCLWRQSACHLVGAGSGGIGVILHWFPWFYSLVSWRILCLFLVIFFYIWWHNNIEEDEVPLFWETETCFRFHFWLYWKRKLISVSVFGFIGNGNWFPFPFFF